jgi:hypothetical protein
MRATRVAAAEAGPPCKSGWSRLVEREARAAAVAQLATGRKRAALNPTAAVNYPASLDDYGEAAQSPLGNTPIESRAPLRPHAALDMMADRPRLVVHSDQSALRREFVPAEMSDYISPP